MTVRDQRNLHLYETGIRDVRYKVLVITVQCSTPLSHRILC